MSEETKVVLNHLLEYLQDKIDTGYHKIFYNDDMHDEKTIDCINAINNTLEEIERLNNIINKALEKSKGLQYRYGYVLDDLVYLLMQGSDKE